MSITPERIAALEAVAEAATAYHDACSKYAFGSSACGEAREAIHTAVRALASLPANESTEAGAKSTGDGGACARPSDDPRTTPAPSPSPAAGPTPEQRAAHIIDLLPCGPEQYGGLRAIIVAEIRTATEAARWEAAGLLKESEQREHHWRAEYEGRRKELAKLNRKVSGLHATLERMEQDRDAYRMNVAGLSDEVARLRAQPSPAEREAAEALVDEANQQIGRVVGAGSGGYTVDLLQRLVAALRALTRAAPQPGQGQVEARETLVTAIANPEGWSRESRAAKIVTALDAYLTARRAAGKEVQ